MSTFNLGIVAHVDAGKTTLTERLLFATGAIPRIGSVDAGTTQTDSLLLEQRRGITIRAAVATFSVGAHTINLVDTPGHPDFITEVERSLQVLDGAVLVVSAVEAVQAQTVVLMRALQRLAVPTLLFVNKIDRRGADPEVVLAAIRRRLTSSAVSVGRVVGAGTAQASFRPYAADDDALRGQLLTVLVEHDEQLLPAAIGDAPAPAPADLQRRLRHQIATGQAHPVMYGSAVTGAGIAALLDALPLLPAADGDSQAALSGVVFKVERGDRGAKLAYARLFDGQLRVRERLRLADDREDTVTRIEVFEPGGPVDRDSVRAGQIARVHGLRSVQVGDAMGCGTARAADRVFTPPALQAAVTARDPGQRGALHAALVQLAEQDPLINLRRNDDELQVSLYGQVQQEVLEQTLAEEYGIDVAFSETQLVCVERLASAASAVRRIRDPDNPYVATLGLTMAPALAGSGHQVRLAVEVTSLPLYVFNTVEAYAKAVEDYADAALQRGPRGWTVVDWVLTVTESGYISPTTKAADVRKVTGLVLADALAKARTVLCEPISGFRLEMPADTLPAALRLLSAHRAVPAPPLVIGDWCVVEGEIPAAELDVVQRTLHASTRGEGVLEAHFRRYAPAPDGGL